MQMLEVGWIEFLVQLQGTWDHPAYPHPRESPVTSLEHHGDEWSAPEECPSFHWIASGFLFVTVHLRRYTAALPALSIEYFEPFSRKYP